MYGSTEVRLDLVTNRKILYVSSPFLFENNTSHNIMIKFGNHTKNIVEGETHKLGKKNGENSIPVPIDCIEKYF